MKRSGIATIVGAFLAAAVPVKSYAGNGGQELYDPNPTQPAQTEIRVVCPEGSSVYVNRTLGDFGCSGNRGFGQSFPSGCALDGYFPYDPKTGRYDRLAKAMIVRLACSQK